MVDELCFLSQASESRTDLAFLLMCCFCCCVVKSIWVCIAPAPKVLSSMQLPMFTTTMHHMQTMFAVVTLSLFLSSHTELYENHLPQLNFCTLSAQGSSLLPFILSVAFFIGHRPSASWLSSSLHRSAFYYCLPFPKHRKLYSSQRCCIRLDMSDLSSSPPRVVAHGSQSATGGTCFLDLPRELREMIYDLSIPEFPRSQFPLPGKPKLQVPGINLLQSCKQIRQETHGRIWFRSWTVRLRLLGQVETSSIDVDLDFALSSVHDLTLVKIRSLTMFVDIEPDSLSWGPVNLRKLSMLKSLTVITMVITVGTYEKIMMAKSEDLYKSVFLTGIVAQILPQIPRHVRYFNMSLTYYDADRKYRHSEAFDHLVKRYECLRGSACEP